MEYSNNWKIFCLVSHNLLFNTKKRRFYEWNRVTYQNEHISIAARCVQSDDLFSTRVITVAWQCGHTIREGSGPTTGVAKIIHNKTLYQWLLVRTQVTFEWIDPIYFKNAFVTFYLSFSHSNVCGKCCFGLTLNNSCGDWILCIWINHLWLLANWDIFILHFNSKVWNSVWRKLILLSVIAYSSTLDVSYSTDLSIFCAHSFFIFNFTTRLDFSASFSISVVIVITIWITMIETFHFCGNKDFKDFEEFQNDFEMSHEINDKIRMIKIDYLQIEWNHRQRLKNKNSNYYIMT